jgi:hypothetical protein
MLTAYHKRMIELEMGAYDSLPFELRRRLAQSGNSALAIKDLLKMGTPWHIVCHLASRS